MLLAAVRVLSRSEARFGRGAGANDIDVRECRCLDVLHVLGRDIDSALQGGIERVTKASSEHKSVCGLNGMGGNRVDGGV